MLTIIGVSLALSATPAFTQPAVDPRLIVPATRFAPAYVVRAGDSPSRVERGLVGGLIGAAAGVAVCTLISNTLAHESGEGFTTCTAKGNTMFGVGGFVLGFWIGASTAPNRD